MGAAWRMRREAATLNAAMGTRMTERFSAPGATLIKLFGRPEDESAEFADRARRVADIGVRTATAQAAFITALTLVSALALAWSTASAAGSPCAAPWTRVTSWRSRCC